MKTFTQLKELARNPHFAVQKENCTRNLTNEMIDDPIIDLVNRFNKLPYCFTLQSCYGHFVYDDKDSHDFDPLPTTYAIETVEYRIAYLALCIENSASGKDLLVALKEIPTLDPTNIQFGCAEWFWKQQINSYVLQVEPDRFKHHDTATLDYAEALSIEKIRNQFFGALDRLLGNELQKLKTA